MNTEIFEALTGLLTPDKWVESETGCWLWQRGQNKGYGKISTRKGGKPVTMNASRVALGKKLGRPVRDGMQACHTCDVPLCVNPDHLYEGTPRDNAADMMTRSRHNNSFIKGGLATRKLTEEQVIEIRDAASKGALYPPMADKYGVSIQTIANAVLGKFYGFNNVDARGENAERWKHRASRSLTDDQVREIRMRYAGGEKQAALESEYGLGGGTVSRIVNGKLYANVLDEPEQPN